MSDKGWIKFYRCIQDCEIWDNNEPFDSRSAWMDLLLSCNHADKRIIFNGNPMTVKRGQYLTSVRKLAERWSWSVNKTARYLKLIEELGMIKRDSDNHRTLLTIVKYEVFQGEQNTDEHTDRYTDEYTDESQTRIKELKKSKEVLPNGNTKKVFTPPTLEEVEAYCKERGNQVDPVRWWHYYNSKNWMIGRNRMKNWKSAVITWEQEDKRKVGNNGSTTDNGSTSTEDPTITIDGVTYSNPFHW